MKLKNTFIILFIVILSQSTIAQVTFKTSVSKDKLGLNERLKIEFSLNKQGADNFTPPSFKNFRIIAGPSQSTSFSMINGVSSFNQTYVYVIQPVKKGTFVISSASAEYNGQTIRTNTVKIVVTDAVAVPKDENDPRYIASNNVHLVAEISNSKPYVGETVNVVFKLYININKVSIRNTQEVSSPSFNGFWNQNIAVPNLVVQQGNYNGSPMKYVVVKKSVIIPQKSGKLFIDPMEIEISVGVPNGRRDLFGNMMFENVNYVVSSGKKLLMIKNLPVKDKPANFNGAVGNFNFKVVSNKTNLGANESAQIKVQVLGKGNLKLFELPKLTTPNGLEVYAPEHKENVKTSLSGIRGSVSNQYTIVPEENGKFKIPGLSFSYFNLKDNSYHQIKANDLFINAKEVANRSSSGSIGTTKQSIVFNEKNIRYIKLRSDFSAINTVDFLGSKVFYLALLIPLIIIPISIVLGKKRKERVNDILGNKRRLADKLARKYLSKAKKRISNKDDFYIVLEKALHNYLKAKLHIETSEMSKDNIQELLTKKGVENDTISSFMKLIEDCDLARYTPSADVKMKDDFEKAKSIISKIDKHF